MKAQVTQDSEKKTNGNSVDATSKIDAIKELIFGENIQAYDSEFESLKSDILAKKEALEELIDSVRINLEKSIDSISTDLNIRITDLENSLEEKLDNLDNKKVNRKHLSELFIKLGEKISG